MKYEARVVMTTTPFEAPDDFRAKVLASEVFRILTTDLKEAGMITHVEVGIRRHEGENDATANA